MIRHAEQFRESIPRRPAGSQQEEIASAYILGHLQKAGYVVRLESVPVGNTVSSSDVIALPPSGSDPQVVVVASYDTPAAAEADATAVGMLLESARALNVTSPDHSMEFAALGAEHTDLAGGHLGSRRLAELIRDQDAHPLMVVVAEVNSRGPLRATGSRAAELLDIARRMNLPVEAASPTHGVTTAGVFSRAGLPTMEISGGVSATGRALLPFLARQGS